MTSALISSMWGRFGDFRPQTSKWEDPEEDAALQASCPLAPPPEYSGAGRSTSSSPQSAPSQSPLALSYQQPGNRS